MIFDSFIVKIKRAETPFYARLKRMGKAVLTFQVPIPRALDPIYVLILNLLRLKFEIEERINAACFAYPVLRTKVCFHRKTLADGRPSACHRSGEGLFGR